MEATGIVETVYQNKGGFWTLKLDDNNWYGLGVKQKPDLNKGDNISFSYDKNGSFNNADIKTLEVLKPAAPAQQSSGSTGGGFTDNRQNSIIYQSSRKDAIEVVKMGFEQGALSLPAKKADKLPALLEMINEVTNQFAVEASNPDIKKAEAVSIQAGDDFEE